MLGNLEENSSQSCGMTPRILESLFASIIEEKKIQKDERCEYTCKCSFLELYKEQIVDLLKPSSKNLKLREDAKKGVYVENLTESKVCTVDGVLKLLRRGSANRKVVATNMIGESSRSHIVLRRLRSIFTSVYAAVQKLKKKIDTFVSLLEGLPGEKKIALCQKE
ncbi:kinesin-like protein KIN-12D [Tanacetum coccineum]